MLKFDFSKKNGSIISFCGNRKDFLYKNADNIPLFVLRLIDAEGNYIYTDSLKSKNFKYNIKENVTKLDFSNFEAFPEICVTATVTQINDDEIEWGIAFDNKSDFKIDYIDYPCIVVPYDLASTGGSAYAFRPLAEGCVMDYVEDKSNTSDKDTLVNDFDCIYPGGWVTMQFMGYFDSCEGLYIGAHDTCGIPKTFNCYKDFGGLRFSICSFCGALEHEYYELPFPVVTKRVASGWMSLAECYREFVEGGDFRLPKKVYERDDLPKWYHESPVVAVYPPTSVRGTGYTGPNEFYPYKNAIKYFDDLSLETDATFLAFLAYWEGSAPWAPPYLWPPYGSAEEFCEFVDMMHEKGHLVGLYGSGTGWTDRSLVTDYDNTEARIKNKYDDIMQTYADNTKVPGMCDTIRTGYRMCPAHSETQKILVDQAQQIIGSNIDFYQILDQNLGGGATACYSSEHGHKPMYGVWLTEAMRELQKKVNKLCKEHEHPCIIGCEGATADCFIEELPFNDLRYGQVASRFRIVPAYEYIFHEYVVNFMGNQHDFNGYAPWQKNPDSYLFRLAYSFIAGDMLTVILKSGGELHWQWGMSWLEPGPNQTELKLLLKHLVAMRKGAGKKYLHFGRMLACDGVEVSGEPYILYDKSGRTEEFPYVLHSLWRAQDGEKAYFFANFSRETRTVKFSALSGHAFDCLGNKILHFVDCDDNKISIEIPPMSSVGFKLSDEIL